MNYQKNKELFSKYENLRQVVRNSTQLVKHMKKVVSEDKYQTTSVDIEAHDEHGREVAGVFRMPVNNKRLLNMLLTEVNDNLTHLNTLGRQLNIDEVTFEQLTEQR